MTALEETDEEICYWCGLYRYNHRDLEWQYHSIQQALLVEEFGVESNKESRDDSSVPSVPKLSARVIT